LIKISLHISNKSAGTFEVPLMMGNNFIGRNILMEKHKDFNDSKISRDRHCCFCLEQSSKGFSISIFDTGSKNGTYVSDFENWPMKEYDVIYIDGNDTVIIGDTTLKILAEGNVIIEKATFIQPKVTRKDTVLMST
jgi:hypothetical protein